MAAAGPTLAQQVNTALIVLLNTAQAYAANSYKIQIKFPALVGEE